MKTTRYCLDHYRFHHPEAEQADLVDAILLSEEIPSDIAMSLLGRRRSTKDRYFLAPDRRGLFVLTKNNTFFNYLRFQRQQTDFCKKHWPLPTLMKGKPAEVPKKSLTQQVRELPHRHPEVGFSLRGLDLEPAFREAAGSRNRALLLLGRSKKFETVFDQETWEVTHRMIDPESGLEFLVCGPSGYETKVSLAA